MMQAAHHVTFDDGWALPCSLVHRGDVSGELCVSRETRVSATGRLGLTRRLRCRSAAHPLAGYAYPSILSIPDCTAMR